MMEGYLSPQEFIQLMQANTTAALEYIIGLLYGKHLEMVVQQQCIDREDDEDLIGQLEYSMKTLKREESSLHRLESGLQSRLKTP